MFVINILLHFIYLFKGQSLKKYNFLIKISIFYFIPTYLKLLSITFSVDFTALCLSASLNDGPIKITSVPPHLSSSAKLSV
jgi:hypothetical protein